MSYHPRPGEQAESSIETPLTGTGDDRVDQAVARLAELDGLPVHDHAALVDEVHRALQDTLAEEET